MSKEKRTSNTSYSNTKLVSLNNSIIDTDVNDSISSMTPRKSSLRYIRENLTTPVYKKRISFNSDKDSFNKNSKKKSYNKFSQLSKETSKITNSNKNLQFVPEGSTDDKRMRYMKHDQDTHDNTAENKLTPPRKKVKLSVDTDICSNTNIFAEDEKGCNISFFNDKSMNEIVNSYLKKPSEHNISLLECVDIEKKELATENTNFYLFIDDKFINLLKEICDLLDMNFDSVEYTQKGMETILDQIKLKIITSSKIIASEHNKDKENENNKSLKYDLVDENDYKEKITYLENLILSKDNYIKNEQLKLTEYRKIETTLRNEIDDLYKKLNYEHCLLKHAEDNIKNLEYKNKQDNNTFIVDNIERLGNISKENAQDYLSELNIKNDELVLYKKQNKTLSNKICDMEIIVDELLKKLADKKEREIDEEIDKDDNIIGDM